MSSVDAVHSMTRALGATASRAIDVARELKLGAVPWE
jgi:hypothetical protein